MTRRMTKREVRQADWMHRHDYPQRGFLVVVPPPPEVQNALDRLARKPFLDYSEVVEAGGELFATQDGDQIAGYSCTVCKARVWVEPPAVLLDPKCDLHQPKGDN